MRTTRKTKAMEETMKRLAISLSVCSLAAVCFATGSASAQPAAAAGTGVSSVRLHHGGVWSSDPLMRELRLRARGGHFVLAGTLERETVTNTAGRTLSVCLSDARDVAQTAGWKPTNDVPLAVSWNGGSTVVTPGECAHIQAARVVLRPAAQVPAGVVLRGRVTAGSRI
jgi:hypothetical protein